MGIPRTATRHNLVVTRMTLLMLSVLAVLSTVRTVQNAVGRKGGSDFHSYWLDGLNLRQGRDPYRASLEGVEPDPPIRFLDAQVIDEPPIAQPSLGRTLVNTAPLALPLFTFSLVSWPLARGMWLVVNFALAICVRHLVFRAFPEHRVFTRTERWTLSLAFFSFASTRASVWVGQTTLLVFALMLAALLCRSRAAPGLPSASSMLLAGICLGFGLSKYSLALPLVMLLVLRWRRGDWLIVGVSLGVQMLGILVLAGLARVSPAAVVIDYVDRLRYMVPVSMNAGVKLLTLIEGEARTPVLMGVGLLLSCAAALGYWWRRARLSEPLRPLAEYHALTILVLLALLVIYHGLYDVALAVLFVPLGWYASVCSAPWRLSAGQAQLVRVATVAFVGVLLLPSPTVGVLLSPTGTSLWMWLVRRAVQCAIVLALAVTAWLLVRLGRAGAAPAPSM